MDISPPSQVLHGLQTLLSSLTFSHRRSISTLDEAKESSKWRDGDWLMAVPFCQALLLHHTLPTCQTYTSKAQALQRAPCSEGKSLAGYQGRACQCHDEAASPTSCHARPAGYAQLHACADTPINCPCWELEPGKKGAVKLYQVNSQNVIVF